MSTSADGRWILCDSCGRRGRALVGLRPVPGADAEPTGDSGADGPPLSGWLFVTRGRAERRDRHYCPLCGAKYLNDLQDRPA